MKEVKEAKVQTPCKITTLANLLLDFKQQGPVVKCLDSVLDCIFFNHVVTLAAAMDLVLRVLKVDSQAHQAASAVVLAVVEVLAVLERSQEERKKENMTTG